MGEERFGGTSNVAEASLPAAIIYSVCAAKSVGLDWRSSLQRKEGERAFLSRYRKICYRARTLIMEPDVPVITEVDHPITLKLTTCDFEIEGAERGRRGC